jgi:hypothetical protein
MHVGANVRATRERLDLGLPILAGLSGLSEQRLVELEASADWTVSDLYRVARSLAVDPMTLVAEQTTESPVGAAFRTAENADADLRPTDRRLLQQLSTLGEIGGHLARRLGRPHGETVLAQTTPIDHEAPWKQGYTLGEQARKRLADTRSPIPDLRTFLAGLGVHVVFVTFTDPAIEAAAVRTPEGLSIIALSRTRRRVVQRASRRAILAHELCHLLHDGVGSTSSGRSHARPTTRWPWSSGPTASRRHSWRRWPGRGRPGVCA